MLFIPPSRVSPRSTRLRRAKPDADLTSRPIRFLSTVRGGRTSGSSVLEHTLYVLFGYDLIAAIYLYTINETCVQTFLLQAAAGAKRKHMMTTWTSSLGSLKTGAWCNLVLHALLSNCNFRDAGALVLHMGGWCPWRRT